MATYRLKSKLFSEFDGEKKDKGILGTGISGGQLLLAGGAALAGRNVYRTMAFKGKIGGVGSNAHVQEIARRKASAKKTGNWYNPSSWGNRSNYKSILAQERAANKAIIKGQDPVTAANQLRERMALKHDVSHANRIYQTYQGLEPELLKGKAKTIRDASTAHLWG